MPTPLVIGLGEVLWDVFPESRRPGGARANVAFQATQLGCRGRVASRVGDDADGAELLQYLTDRGLDVDLVQRDSRRPTGWVTVEVSDEGQPSYTIHEDVAWDHLQATPDLLEAVAQADAVCFGTLAQRSEDSRRSIQKCLAAAGRETLLVFDVNLRQSWYDRATIEASLQAASAVKFNDEELRILAKMFEISDREPHDFAVTLRERFDLKWVVMTRGAKGCLISGPDGVEEVPGEPVKVIDTVGAGDAFTAAFITGTLNRWPVASVARFANRIGGLVASRSGAMPDIRDEAAKLREQLAPH